MSLLLKTHNFEINCRPIEKYKLYPNPVKDLSRLEFIVDKDNTQFDVSITDINGKYIQSVLSQKQFDKGLRREILDLSNLVNGSYILQIKTKDETTAIEINKIR